jgi:N-acyl homoserine lactone hydrolase
MEQNTTKNNLPKVHVIQTGSVKGNKSVTRGMTWRSVLRRREYYEAPVLVYIIEHPKGYIAIDTGANAQGWTIPFWGRPLAVRPIIEGEKEEIGPRMKSVGLDPADVRTVILTHLDPDHVGGVRWFPNAEILVHRPEYDFASTSKFMGKNRCQPDRWPEKFNPTLYDLDPEPYGPFPKSKTLANFEDLCLVPLPGHSIGQVGVILRTNNIALFFSGDHTTCQDWFVEDWAAGRLYGNVFINLWMKPYCELGAETSRRIHRFTEEVPTILLPAHDADASHRLEAMETIQFE